MRVQHDAPFRSHMATDRRASSLSPATTHVVALFVAPLFVAAFADILYPFCP